MNINDFCKGCDYGPLGFDKCPGNYNSHISSIIADPSSYTLNQEAQQNQARKGFCRYGSFEGIPAVFHTFRLENGEPFEEVHMSSMYDKDTVNTSNLKELQKFTEDHKLGRAKLPNPSILEQLEKEQQSRELA